jgi:hypothetical protein
MLPDPGCYEERYRRGRAVFGLAVALLVVGWGLLSHSPLFAVILPVLVAIPTVLTLALRPVAFRADHAGITLGSDRVQLRNPAVFIPWADVEKIIFYSAYTRTDMHAQYIGIQRRDGAPALPSGNHQAPGCPVPGVAAGATQRVIHWRLDRDQLAAVTAAVAPGTPVIEARNDPDRRIEGSGQGQDPQPWAV